MRGVSFDTFITESNNQDDASRPAKDLRVSSGVPATGLKERWLPKEDMLSDHCLHSVNDEIVAE